MSGGYSMGYDPYDFFDLGEYYQKGTVETRFGSKQELVNMINTAHAYNMKVIADILINHRTGGSTNIVYYDNDELIFVRNGYGDKPGPITYINLGPSKAGRWVYVPKFAGSCIHEYTDNLGGWVDKWVYSSGWVYLEAPAHDPANGGYGYSVWNYCGVG